jgi:membrane-associated phospholipid phosphatase
MKYVILLLLLIGFTTDSNSQHRFKSKIPYQQKSELNIDVKIFRAFNNIESPFLNSVVSVTNHSVIPVSALVPAGLYISARANENRYDENSSVLLALSEIVNAGTTQGLKMLVGRDRPFRSLNNVHLSETTSVSGSYSFPSGHSSGTFVIATLLTLRYPDEPFLIAGSYLYATITSLGRIYWGVHYPSDVLCGMLIGAGSAALVYSLRSEILPAKDKLFNQSSKPDERGKSARVPLVLGSVIAADVLNSLIFRSQIPVLKNTSVDYSADGFYSLRYKANF